MLHMWRLPLRAFDTIDHDVLLSRLDTHLAVRGTAHKWIASYLTGRTQAVHASSVSSSTSSLQYGVPQGSVLGPKFFCIYSGPLAHIARRHNIEVHMYADDTQLYLPFDIDSDPLVPLRRMENCISEISEWMRLNKLKLNEDKTEFLVVASDRMKHKIPHLELTVGTHKVKPSRIARNLGVVFDDVLKMDDHVQAVCKKAFFHLHNIRSVRKCLSRKATEQLIHAFVTSALDSANALLCGVSANLTGKLQRIQNCAGRILTLTRQRDHISPILKQLHWLPVTYRIKYKILLLMWRAQNNLAPRYVADMLTRWEPARTGLRSQSTNRMLVPRTRLKTYGDRAFSVAGPVLWNKLPVSLRTLTSMGAFKIRLKTLLFQEAYP